MKKLLEKLIKNAITKAVSEIDPQELLRSILIALDAALEKVGIDIIDETKFDEDAKK